MKSSIAFLVVSGLTAAVSATGPLATVVPCGSCPKDVSPAPITVTSQYQPVQTCTPEEKCTTKKGKKHCKIVPNCSTYDFVSTYIPCDGGASTTLVTKTDQVVRVAHVSTVLTSYLPCPTPTMAPSWNGTIPTYKNESCTSTKYQTMVVDSSCPFNEIGPIALPPYDGSGLCKKCAEDKNGDKSQGVEVIKCLDGVCTAYTETWVSTKAQPATSASEASFSSQTYCPSAGTYTIPVTTTCSPSGPEYTKPVTKTFSITTSVNEPKTIEITKTVYITFTGKPAPTAAYSSSECGVSTSTYCPNGVHTIPIATTITPSNPEYTKPVTTTVYYTTTVTDGPKHVECTKTITVTFTSYVCPATVISGSTQTPTKPATASATSTSAGVTTTSPSSTSAHGPTRSMITATSSGPSVTTPGGSHPTAPAGCQYQGCFDSPSGSPNFSLVESSGKMNVELCTSECVASGSAFSGLYNGDCYCASSIESCEESESGKCDLPCPGNASESCGGTIKGGKKPHKLFDVYECSVPTSTTATSDGTTSTTSATPDPSSDPDPEPEKRSLQADMELSGSKGRDLKLRRGGMLRSPEKREKGNVLAKRDFGLKRPFGL